MTQGQISFPMGFAALCQSCAWLPFFVIFVPFVVKSFCQIRVNSPLKKAFWSYLGFVDT